MERSDLHNREAESRSNETKARRPLQFVFASFRQVALFAAIFAGLQLSWQSLRGTAIEFTVIHGATVKPATLLINLITPDVHARAIDYSVRAPGGGLNVLNGCEGLEAAFLLIAAFIVAPLSFRSRFLGLVIGIAMVFMVNQARILCLFYAYRYDRSLFYSLHATVAPIVVVLCVAGYFFAWLAHDRHDAAQSA